MNLRHVFRWGALGLIALTVMLTPATAQENPPADFEALCRAVLTRAVAVTEADCEPTARNEACYGYAHVRADYQPNADPARFPFAVSGDIVPLHTLAAITTEPLDLQQGTWGMSVLKFQANLPATRPGENVTFILFGDTQIENASGDLSAFYLTTGLGELVCNQIPQDALLIKVPQGLEVAFTVNGVQVTLASTAILKAAPGDHLVMGVVEGHGVLGAAGQTRFIPAGFRAQVPLSADGRAPTGAPSAAVAGLFDARYAPPLGVLGRLQPGALPAGAIPLTLEGPIEAINDADSSVVVYGFALPVDSSVLSAFDVGEWVLVEGYYDSADVAAPVTVFSIALDPRYMILLGAQGAAPLPTPAARTLLGAGLGGGSFGSLPIRSPLTPTATPLPGVTVTPEGTLTPSPTPTTGITDAIPPVTTASGNPPGPNGKFGWYITPVTWTLTATDEGGSGVAYIEYSLNAQATWNLYAGPITLGEGQWHLWFRAVDNASNVEEPQVVGSAVDLTPPQASMPDEFRGVAGQPVDLFVDASDNLSGVGRVVWSTGESGVGLTQISHVWAEPGEDAVNVQVQDGAGNWSGASTTVHIEAGEASE